MGYGDHADDCDDFIVCILLDVQRKLGLSDADIDMESLDRDLRLRYGGDAPYICKTDPRRAKRVRDEFNGRNRDEICNRYNLSRSQFYAIIKGD